MKKISIKYMTDIHSDSLRDLDFYGETLEILNNRLNEIAKANTGMEAMIGVEHYQNMFVIHKEKIQLLKHNLKENIGILAMEAKNSNGYLDEVLLVQNRNYQEEYLAEVNLFDDMKRSFYLFAEKWM